MKPGKDSLLVQRQEILSLTREIQVALTWWQQLRTFRLEEQHHISGTHSLWLARAGHAFKKCTRRVLPFNEIKKQ